jgi:hypothetical protein
MSEPRTKPRRGWWISTALVICLVAIGLRVGIPVYRRTCALAALRRLDFKGAANSEKPGWLSRLDRPGWTHSFLSIDAVFNNFSAKSIRGSSRLSRTETVDLLSQIKVFGELRHLELSWTALADDDLVLLECFQNLTALNLQATPITGEGLKHLAKLPKLRALILTDTLIDDAGLAHLARLTKLESLHLDRTPISNAGLTHLAKLSNLRELTVSGTAVTDAGLDELLKTHPALSVSDD